MAEIYDVIERLDQIFWELREINNHLNPQER
ncbi:hypothetical protein CGERO_03875 [Corynebacterium gerontici]|uniref:Uncharacterized protein n=1 Tax=Corynebacterium gerontici TaxID=2079234 RepID=A0A3G6IZG5_9CORY|nr:hypothetical protein CGERO_03875 [Corynebacterium gerontici]